ncbi:hypothetical protein QYE76_026641 [Lolium multiflorum]|uniref:Uncharacterized protein n=1 Tax=Lolium multiflorum TaxID=4521 RepID=A0AAD8VVS9_LOLMU|nr:hypothetical protein QYE76_026641 [Lolium multiflorum]
MSMHLIKFGFTPSYRIWNYHGEKAKKRARKEEWQIQPRGEYDTGFDRCLENLANGNVPESSHVELETPQDAETSEDPEENTKEYYEALFASQKPLHENTEVTQLDAIARLMALKCHRNLCRDGFDELLVIVGSLLPKGHLLPQNFYYSTKLLSDLKMSSQQIHAYRNGDGQKRQTTIAKNILRYLPVLPRIQRLFMTEDTSAKTIGSETGFVWVNPQSETQCTSYVSKFKQKYGEEANREAEDFDPEVAVLAGEGLKHGRLWFRDGVVDPATVPSLRQIRRGRGDGRKGAGGPGARTELGAVGSGVRSSSTDDAADATAQMMQQQALMSWLMSQTALSSPPGSIPAPPPYSMPWMPPPPTQSPGTPLTVNNMNIIRSMNRDGTFRVHTHGKGGTWRMAGGPGGSAAKAFAVRAGLLPHGKAKGTAQKQRTATLPRTAKEELHGNVTAHGKVPHARQRSAARQRTCVSGLLRFREIYYDDMCKMAGLAVFTVMPLLKHLSAP